MFDAAFYSLRGSPGALGHLRTAKSAPRQFSGQYVQIERDHPIAGVPPASPRHLRHVNPHRTYSATLNKATMSLRHQARQRSRLKPCAPDAVKKEMSQPNLDRAQEPASRGGTRRQQQGYLTALGSLPLFLTGPTRKPQGGTSQRRARYQTEVYLLTADTAGGETGLTGSQRKTANSCQ